MSGLQHRIDGLVQQGQVSPEEGRELSRAVRRRGSRWGWVSDPFERLSTEAGLALAAAGLLLQLGVARLGVRFDGAFDMHLSSTPPWKVAALDLVVSGPVVALGFWLAAVSCGKRPRFIDFLWTLGVARLPLVLTGLARPLMANPEETARKLAEGAPPTELLPIVLLVLPAMGLFFFWLYRAYRTASGLTGVRAGVSFVAGMVVLELLTKWLLVVVGGFESSLQI